MENTNNSNVPAVNIQGFIETVRTAPEVLEKNTLSRANAERAVNNLLAKIQEEGMNQELDSNVALFVEKLKTTAKAMAERRQPITQIMDALKKQYTTQESDIKGWVDTLQDHRNKYATVLMEEKRRQEREAMMRLAKSKEETEIVRDIEKAIARNYGNLLSAAKKAVVDLLENMTLQNVEETRKAIDEFHAGLGKREFADFQVQGAVYLSPEEVAVIKKETMARTYGEYNLEFAQAVNETKREQIDRIESKVAELKRINQAGAEEAARIQREIEARKLEAERVAKEEADAVQKKAAADAEAKAAAAKLMASIASMAEISAEAPKVKEGYKITITNPTGYVLIFQFWFEKEGSAWPADKIERMTISRMVAFCEAWAAKKEEKIKSDLVVYSEIYKAK